MNKKVLVTGIGGNVGQGILRNIVHTRYDISLIGTNTDLISGANHLCNKVYEVPFSTSSKYIQSIKDICKNEKVDLIIPSTDLEVYYLAISKNELPKLVAPSAKISEIFLNKYKTSQAFQKYSLPFAETFLPSEYGEEFNDYIVKPAEGRGSRDLHIKPKNPKQFSSEYVIQKLYKGIELTTSFYITKKGELLGQITLIRKLTNGYTSQCEVTFDYDEVIVKIIKRMVDKFKIIGPYNIQSIASEDGLVMPFEINGRISGTNSIRSQFGFEDVKYVLDEYLYEKEIKKPKIKKGSATRILMDTIYPDISLSEITDNTKKHYEF